MTEVNTDLSSIRGSIRSSIRSSKNSEPIFEEPENQGLPLQYGPNDIPEWYKVIPLGFQQAMVAMAGLFVTPYIVSDAVCAGPHTIELRTRLISTAFVVTGIATILQSTFGIRLANLQGPSLAFFSSLYAFSSLPEFRCHHDHGPHRDGPDSSERSHEHGHGWGPEEPDDYMHRMQLINGSLICASLLSMFLGLSGLIGIIAKRVGPITICSIIALLCLDNVGSVLDKAMVHWISVLQFTLLCIFAVFLAEYQVPIPYFKSGKLKWTRSRLFGQFPYLFAILVSYFVAAILSATGAEPPEGPARIDKRAAIDVLKKSPWFQVPYPGQFGMPKFHLGLFITMLLTFLASAVEAIGGYHVLAKISEEKPPPTFVINRSTFFEGFGSFIAGFCGLGVGLTTYSENIAAVSITRVASRFVMQTCGILMIFLGLFTKFAAIIATIPDPIIGGILGMAMCLIFGVAMTNLQTVDLKLSRNITILGIAIMCGMYIPEYFNRRPIHTGTIELDQALSILFHIRMIIGGFIAFVLDNLVPGATLKQRGFHDSSTHEKLDFTNDKDAYDYPDFINRCLIKIPLISKLPFMPPKERLKKSLNYLKNKVHPEYGAYEV